MSEHVYKHHNKTLLLYHFVFPAKYRREVFSESVSSTLREVCIGISMRYEIRFVEVGMDEDHVHFLVQSVPTMSVSKIVTIIKSITAREIFSQRSEKVSLGRESLDKWFLREHCERIRQCRRHQAIHREPGIL